MTGGAPSSAKVWLLETTAIAGSACCLAGLAVVLAAYDGRPIFDWHGVTLNAVVAVLSTAAKAALLYAVEALISQWKWIVFARGARPLMDFETIDGASRGPYGSLELLWKCKAIGFLRTGALVVLLSLAVDPFTQQLVQYRQRVVYTRDNGTTVTRAARYSRGSEYSMQIAQISSTYVNRTNVFADADFSMQSAILYGLDQPLQNVVEQGAFTCPTGNCTWPPFESLAVCSRCTDLTDSLERLTTDGGLYASLETDDGAASVTRDGGTAFRLANGLYIDNQNGWAYGAVNEGASDDIFGAVIMTVFGTGNASESVSMGGLLDSLIWSASMIRVGPDPTNASAVWPDLPRSAKECAVFYCVNRYETAVVNGTLRETSVQVPNVTRMRDSWQVEGENAGLVNETIRDSLVFNSYFSVLPRTDLTLQSPATGDKFNVSQAAVDSLSAHFQSAFASTLRTLNVTQPEEKDDDATAAVWGRLNGFYMNSSQVQYSPGVMQGLFASADLGATFASMAASMSNAVRTTRADADDEDDNDTGGVGGSRGDLVTFYRIAWPWISLHCLVVAAGAVFLVVTVWENQEGRRRGVVAPVWKSSSLAVMSRGAAVREVLEGAQRLRHMEEKAKTTRVSLFEKDMAASYPLQQVEFDALEQEEGRGFEMGGSKKAKGRFEEANGPLIQTVELSLSQSNSRV